MSTSVESTAAMPATTEPDDSFETETAAPQPAAEAQAVAESAGAATHPGSGSAPARKPVSPNVIISTLVTLFAATMGMMGTLLMLQFNSLGDRIDALGNRIEAQSDRIDTQGDRIEAQSTDLRNEISRLRTEMRTEISGLRTEMRTEISGLRTEMQAGFREVNATLLDHTERLARLEAAGGPPNDAALNP